MRKLKRLINKGKAKNLALCTAVSTVAMAVPALAADGDTTATLTEALSTGLNTAVTDFVSMVVAILPIGLTVFTATFAVKKGMKFFKNISNN